MGKERNAIVSFSKTIKSFIGRCQKQLWSPEELDAKIATRSPLDTVEKQFLDIASDLYDLYIKKLETTGEIDFNILMQDAIQFVNKEKTEFKGNSNGDLAALQYICIDEFQDFTEMFHQLLVEIRKHNPKVELFCVGDDWQAINGFAGSDLRFFSEFDHYINKSCRRYITTNHRSSCEIVALGNALMAGLGKSAVSNKPNSRKVILADVDTLEPCNIEIYRHGQSDKTTPSVLRVVSQLLSDGLDIVMLSRKNKFEYKNIEHYCNAIQAFFPKDKERITISTAHKYKGKKNRRWLYSTL